MKARLEDKSVCLRCYGTGTEVIQTGRYSYSRPCSHVPQRELPMDEPEDFEADEQEPSRRAA